MKKKIAIVTYSHGREGTSALMGILRCFGYNVPNKTVISSMNPKGFFEDPEFDQKIFEFYNRNNGDLSLPPTQEELLEIFNQNKTSDFKKLFADLIKGESKYALKAPRYLLLPLLEEVIDDYQFKIIHITRNEKDHIKSVYRVWQNIKGIELEKKRMKKNEIRKWIKKWKGFGKHQLAKNSLPVIEISFEDIIKNKEKSILQIAEFLEEEQISVDIFNWIEPKLVNRKKLSLKW
ncbi:sulfotransferase domain-containing protein [Mesoflavibacter zeaxanthinifaciens]|uniref:sulfotransferase domain-containing protein n=1 Tax=Mesoflavibacter zeaxanthinifaciens TaxID=393060 RepID=UPI003A95DD0E